MILIEVIFAIAIACIGIGFLFKLPFFAFLATVPIWMFVTVCLGVGTIYGAINTNPEPIESGRPQSFLEALILIFIRAMVLAVVVIFVGGLALVFGLSLPLFWHDPILARTTSSFLSLCLGYLAGMAIASETKRRSPDTD